jgi:hypothetical protein
MGLINGEIRLSKVCKELNLSLHTIVDILSNKKADEIIKRIIADK